jgi:UDPglucose 6-dehydrogenase
MRIGWVGLGRLGLPCALQLAAWGHKVIGYDTRSALISRLNNEGVPDGHVEPGVLELWKELLAAADTHEALAFVPVTSLADAVHGADVVFVAVQTPHAPDYDGTKPVAGLPARDFEYGYLVQAVRDIASLYRGRDDELTLVIVSTVLPGTTDRLIRPLLRGTKIRLVYSPQFIAMGTVLRDFAEYEFLLLGSDDFDAATVVRLVFETGGHKAGDVIRCTIADAELIKVAYNTFISMKLVWANHLAQVCDSTGADADAVVDALALATRRVVSSAYMRPGLGDGGACHPRDLIALADLEQRAGLNNFFGGLAHLRDEQTRDLARLTLRWAEQASLNRVTILGTSYKPNVALTDGSPALLLQHFLNEAIAHNPLLVVGVEAWQPDPLDAVPPVDGMAPRVWVIGTNFRQFRKLPWPAGSVVIDPWGDIRNVPPGVTLVRPGRR